MPGNVLDFEKPIAQLEEKIAQVKRLTREEGIDRSQEIALLEAHVERLRREIYQNLTPWDRTLIARHPARRVLAVEQFVKALARAGPGFARYPA